MSGEEADDVFKTVLYRPELYGGAAWPGLIREVLRGPSMWTDGERELFAAAASRANRCAFCADIHSRTASLTTGMDVTPDVLAHGPPEGSRLEVVAVLDLIEKLAIEPELVRQEDVEQVRGAGVSDEGISDALAVLFVFNVLNRVNWAATVGVGNTTLANWEAALPIFIIGINYVPYVARPIRGQVLALKQSEFVLAAVGLGVPDYRILLRDILPNVMTTLIVFVPLMMAINMITESALSFLSIGVQPPDASWGTIIQDGQLLLYTRPMVSLAPGIAIVVTVLALNVLGDGVRDALDPKDR